VDTLSLVARRVATPGFGHSGHMKLRRPSVIVALLTPFDEDGRLDEPALSAHVDLLVDAGVDALMPCGTTGEAALLSDEEVANVVRASCAAAADRVPVLAHVGRPGTAPTLELARRAVGDGAAAVSAVVPYYYPVGSDELRAHYAALVEGLDGTPVYGYTIPDRTHNELEPELLGQLAGDGLSGLKDSTKSIERHREYAAAVPSEDAEAFELLMGTASLVLEALRGGAAGAVLAVANVEPERCVDLARAFREGRGDDAEALQQELAAAERELQADGVIPGLKRAVAERVDGYGQTMRAPLGTGGGVAGAIRSKW
jgi:4-hydroxy-tetrahydrodipicolinate synthase